MQQICPILQDLITAMSKVQSLPADFAPKVGLFGVEILVMYVLLSIMLTVLASATHRSR